jgi:hypothetical protein
MSCSRVSRALGLAALPGHSCSARGWFAAADDEVMMLPTAVQVLAATQETDERNLCALGMAVGCTFQAVPVKNSARACLPL